MKTLFDKVSAKMQAQGGGEFKREDIKRMNENEIALLIDSMIEILEDHEKRIK